MPVGDAVISFDHVRLRFGEETIFSDVSFVVERGEFACLLGPSGCGKSTTLRLMGDLIQGDGGTIRVAGRAPSESWNRLAFVFQSPRLLPWRTTLGNVMLGMELRRLRLDPAQMEARARQMLDLVGLGRDLQKYPRVLSGGEKQRASLARALAVDPEIIVMDEPFSALDPATRRRLRAELISIWQETGKTIVFVTHDVDEALELADTILVFSSKPTRVLQTLRLAVQRPRSVEMDSALIQHRNNLLGMFGSAPPAGAPAAA